MDRYPHTHQQKKTVLALYAIAMSLRNKHVLCTLNLSRHSASESIESILEFSDVGLMTGGVIIQSQCVLLEIWHSMQYKGSDVIRKVVWIIFDEVYYMCDRERGWYGKRALSWPQKTLDSYSSLLRCPMQRGLLIGLQRCFKVAFYFFFYHQIMMTVDACYVRVEWEAYEDIVQVHRQPCHVFYPDYRPTTLQHYVFPSGSDGLYLLVDEKGKYCEDIFHKGMLLCLLVKVRGKGGMENGRRAFRPDIMEAIAWAKGSKFYEIMEITQVFEGSLIRAIRRLDDVL
ncbi:unnamed protein product [Ilex paraguariensis]|uniref:ATP-dependent RNA helicase Ski2/MTR4 C-terminal domain-containing protein n=1 Tax=Ilex paraguariensis TaxID=185542 RepID=A0ABC8REF0_9AQUA